MDSEQVANKVVDAFFAEMKRERRSRYIRSFMSLLIFGLVFWASFGKQFFGTEKENKARPEYSMKFDNASTEEKAVIGVLPIQGVISGDMLGTKPPKSLWGSSSENMVWTVRNAFAHFETEKNLTVLILFIDSPGGTVLASDEIYNMILRWKQKTGKRVIAYFNGIAASGGYYVAQAADIIVANPNTLTGSIGVIMGTMNFSEAGKKFGIKSESIKTGEFKDIGSPWKEMSAGDRKILQSMVDESFGRFLEIIHTGRKGKLTKEKIRKLADGRIYSGQQAYAAGLVDMIGDYYGIIQAEFSVISLLNYYKEAEVVVYQPKEESLLDSLLKGLAPQNKIPFIGNVPEFSRPQLMYIWPGGTQ